MSRIESSSGVTVVSVFEAWTGVEGCPSPAGCVAWEVGTDGDAWAEESFLTGWLGWTVDDVDDT